MSGEDTGHRVDSVMPSEVKEEKEEPVVTVTVTVTNMVMIMVDWKDGEQEKEQVEEEAEAEVEEEADDGQPGHLIPLISPTHGLLLPLLSRPCHLRRLLLLLFLLLRSHR